MKLYHGTSDKRLLEVMEKGLQPRGAKDGRWDIPGRPDCIYLTDAYGFFYASNAVEDGGNMVIFEVDVDCNCLLPDEDYIEQAHRHTYGEQEDYNMVATTFAIRDELESYQEYWSASLLGLGNVAHLGPIYSTQIRRYAVIEDLAFSMAFDPTICLANYAIMGAYYRNSMKWLFDPDCEMEEAEFIGDRNEFIRELPRTHIKIFGG